ncbi:MAG TPA: hypothetical protein VFU73_01920 [Actinocrinis sp.]|nr:hypothetical protein [Actinocrinis sp.]
MLTETRGAGDPLGTRGRTHEEGARGDAAAPAHDPHGARGPRRTRNCVAAAAATALLLAVALTACASDKTVGTGAAGNPVASTASPPAAPSASPSVGAASSAPGPAGTQTINPGGPAKGLPLVTPVAQNGALPAGAKYTPIESMGRSADGRTLYLEIMSQAGACGRYVVVVEESSNQVSVGLAHLPVKVGVMCPMLVRIADFPAHLSAPLGNRPVIDLATGKAAGTVGVIPVPPPGGAP